MNSEKDDDQYEKSLEIKKMVLEEAEKYLYSDTKINKTTIVESIVKVVSRKYDI